MAFARLWSAAAIGFGLIAWVSPARAEAPGVYYAWRSLNINLSQCMDRATTALNNQHLQGVQAEGNSVAGQAENATAVFVCLEGSELTTIMLVVSSTDDETAFNLRETLKTSF